MLKSVWVILELDIILDYTKKAYLNYLQEDFQLLDF